MEDIAFNPGKFDKSFMDEDTYHRTLLALGSVANKLTKAGFEDRALWLMGKIHNMVGMHGKFIINPFTPTDLYGMFQIKVWTIPFWIFRVERVNKASLNQSFVYCFLLHVSLIV